MHVTEVQNITNSMINMSRYYLLSFNEQEHLIKIEQL